MKKLSIRELDNYTGTNWSQVPTTILEMGFLSNASDDLNMSFDTFHPAAAKGIADGLDAYFAELDKASANELTDELDAASLSEETGLP